MFNSMGAEVSILSTIVTVLSKPGQWCQSSNCCTVDVAVTPADEFSTAFKSTSSLGNRPKQTISEVQRKLRQAHLQMARLQRDIKGLETLQDTIKVL